jgi:hypothetical protein
MQESTSQKDFLQNQPGASQDLLQQLVSTAACVHLFRFRKRLETILTDS